MITSIPIDSSKWAASRAGLAAEDGRRGIISLGGDPKADIGFLILNLEHVRAIQLQAVPTGSSISVEWVDQKADRSTFFTDAPPATVNAQITGNVVR